MFSDNLLTHCGSWNDNRAWLAPYARSCIVGYKLRIPMSTPSPYLDRCLTPPHLSAQEAVRAGVLRLFREPQPTSPEFLLSLSPGAWKRLLGWLDTSGLALYFLDLLKRRDALHLLPRDVLRRLQGNFRNNTKRTESMIQECCAIQERFAGADVRYAVLKGFSLWPHAVSSLELRSQLDLDFLVAANDAPRAKRVLEERGYRLHAESGRTWEFKTPEPGPRGLQDLYNVMPQRAVELHLEDEGAGALLPQHEVGVLRHVCMPVLPAHWLFLSQALHLFKHITQDSMRTSHLLEFYRHLLARAEATDFWSKVEANITNDVRATLGLSVALYFVLTHIDEDAVPPHLRLWTTDRLPSAVRLWIDRYGTRITVASFPGTKLHLLLQHVLIEEGLQAPRRFCEALLPRRLPPSIVVVPSVEAPHERLWRLFRQSRFVLFRARFHAIEGMRFVIELYRWERLKPRSTNAGQGVLIPAPATRKTAGTKW